MAELTGPPDAASEPAQRGRSWSGSSRARRSPGSPPGRRFHLMILGGGTAGSAAAEAAAALGARVALVARHSLGGDRLRYGVPRVALVGATAAAGGGDFTAVMAEARDLRSELAAETDADRLRRLGVDVIFGQGRFVAADAIEVDGRRLHFRRALVATGARPKPWAIPGLGDLALLSLDTLFDLEHQPRRLGVLGGGERACELAQACARLGSEVHLIERRQRILGRCDPDAAEVVASALRRDGVHLHLATDVRAAHRQGSVKILALARESREIAVDELLLADGRAPNVAGLGLEAAGVDYDLTGIEVDRRLRTSNRRIFAAGDVVAPPGHAHGDDAARAAVKNALLLRRLEVPHTTPRAVFTHPGIAWVGIDAARAKDLGPRVETLELALADGDPSRRHVPDPELLRLHLSRRSGRVLGGTLMAEDAADGIVPLALATRHKLRVASFAETLSSYGARAEIYRHAALEWQKSRQRRPLPQAFFELLLRLSP